MDTDTIVGFFILIILASAAYYIGYIHGQKSFKKDEVKNV